MNDVQVILEELEASNRTSGNMTEHAFRDADALQLIDTSSVHILHAIVNARLDKESTVEVYDFRGDGAMKNLKLHHNSIELGLVKLKTDFLKELKGIEYAHGRKKLHQQQHKKSGGREN